MRSRRVAVATALFAIGLVQLASAGPSQAATSVPYSDPSAVGELTLCNASRQPITSGSVDATPFVAYAIGTSRAPSSLDGTGRTAALYAYQPIKGLDPTQWSGEFLTGYAKYSNAAEPMAAATRLDLSLATFVHDAPPQWNGLVQLRMFLDAPYEAAYDSTYNAATVQVQGKTWTLISATKASCGDGTAVSNEDVLPELHSSATPAVHGSRAGASGTGAAPTGKATGTATSTGTSAAGATSAGGVSPAEAADTKASGNGSSSTPLLIGIAVVVVLGGGGGGAFWWRRRGSRPSS
ncbi:MAG TPA: hypothetical protein VK816_00050 [Jatrophihabitantaceae bacterium]|jgi:hypothetical protein|nr:hypothetical protein [Jatrophihabitantaceae bacterium]